MLDGLMARIEHHLLAHAMRDVMGNQNAIREEKRPKIVAMLNGLFPALADAVRAEVAVVSDAVNRAEQDVQVACENAKLAQEQAASATKTLGAALQAVASANLHAEDAMQAVRASAAALILAKDEFARLSEKSRG